MSKKFEKTKMIWDVHDSCKNHFFVTLTHFLKILAIKTNEIGHKT